MRRIWAVIPLVVIGIIGVQESFALSPPADMVEKYYAREALVFYAILTVIGIAVGFAIMVIVFKKIKKRQNKD